MCLLFLPISFFAGLINLVFGLFKKSFLSKRRGGEMSISTSQLIQQNLNSGSAQVQNLYAVNVSLILFGIYCGL